MTVAALPDLNHLCGEALRALLLEKHEQLLSTNEQLVSTENSLTATREQLLSREREIEHLKLLLSKLHRIAVWAEVGEAGATDRAVGAATGGAGI